MKSIIPLSKPSITKAEIDAVVETLVSDRLSMGPRQARFEEMLADLTRRRHGIAVSSGTAGLHLVLAALGIGPGDEVITTPFSFIASSNAILFVGAKPVFVDIDPGSLNLDPKRIEKAITPRTRAIIAVEVFGNPTHMEAIEKVAQAHEIVLIEDACEGLGGMADDRPIGNFGRASVFGFYPNKQITTGEGGMIVTDDDRIAELCRSMRNQGRSVNPAELAGPDPTNAARYGTWLGHERLGYNYRLNEMACALGIAQMERLDELLEARRELAMRYIRRLMEFDELILPDMPSAQNASWFVFVVRLTDLFGLVERDRIIQGLRRHDIGAANYFPCIHLQPFYREQFGFKPGDFPIAEHISNRTIALPFFGELDETAVELVVQTLKVMLQREQLLKR
ncbi:MAG: DegT/DnrJ/EryC1/StrS family aminotransferase [Phycisphaeraceae bacterium]|nr:DegT/DnrJ/EryC1/StrS family aminotransferase [Phycisphaeraceae bacterium]